MIRHLRVPTLHFSTVEVKFQPYRLRIFQHLMEMGPELKPRLYILIIMQLAKTQKESIATAKAASQRLLITIKTNERALCAYT